MTRFIFLYYNYFAVEFEFILYGSEQFVNENEIGAICINIRTQIKRIKRSFGFVKYMALLFGVLAVSLCAAVALFTKDFRTVTISADGKLYEITTRADTVAEAVEAAGVVLGAEDKVNYELSCSVDDVDGIITVSRPITLTVNLANDTRVITSYSDDASDALQENGIPFDESQDVILGTEDGKVSDGDEITVVITSTKTVEEQEEIPFDTVYVEDNTLYQGDTEVVTEGKNGVVTRTYTVNLEDGVEVSRELVSEVRTEPVNRVVAKGTKVYFTNSRGLNDSFTKQYEMRATAYAPTPENHGYATASGNEALCEKQCRRRSGLRLLYCVGRRRQHQRHADRSLYGKRICLLSVWLAFRNRICSGGSEHRCIFTERIRWIGAFIRGNGWIFSASDRRKVSDRIS